jgi:SpoVK/Ycf46/Vps4 family AAA+-type ATPase
MVDQALCKIELSSFLDNEWGFTEFAPINEKCLLNFFGPPGTGKTMLAKSIGKRLKKDIIQVDYSGLISKWVGDTGKNIKNYFSKATKENMILFFDEADALLMPRNGGGNTEQYNIQNQNIFMQEVDKFKGIVILTTNNFKQYDEALLRRFDHIPFDLPDINMRKNIIKSHLSSKIIWGDDFTIDKLAIDTDGFSGGDLKNVISNGLINNALSVKNKNSDKSTEELVSLLKQTIVEYKFFFEEVLRIKKIKKEHGIISSKKVPLGLAT